MKRFVPSLMLLVALLPSLTQAGVPAKPAEVLPYLETIYKSQDIKAYGALLTDDFRFVLEDRNAGWDKPTEIQTTRKLFEGASVVFSFPKEMAIKPGPQPGTWIIPDVTSSLQVTQKKDGKILMVQTTFTLVVRDEKGQMLIAEWRQRPTK